MYCAHVGRGDQAVAQVLGAVTKPDLSKTGAFASILFFTCIVALL